MAQSSTAIREIKRDVPFLWEGKDKRGKTVKGKTLAGSTPRSVLEIATREALKKQGLAFDAE